MSYTLIKRQRWQTFLVVVFAATRLTKDFCCACGTAGGSSAGTTKILSSRRRWRGSLEGLRFANSIKIERECISMDKASQSPRSHLFTVRVWQEEVKNGQTEWRGKGKMITTGGGHYFFELGGVVALLLTMLSAV